MSAGALIDGFSVSTTENRWDTAKKHWADGTSLRRPWVIRTCGVVIVWEPSLGVLATSVEKVCPASADISTATFGAPFPPPTVHWIVSCPPHCSAPAAAGKTNPNGSPLTDKVIETKATAPPPGGVARGAPRGVGEG